MIQMHYRDKQPHLSESYVTNSSKTVHDTGRFDILGSEASIGRKKWVLLNLMERGKVLR